MLSVMIKGFWNKLEKPIMALAPLYDVTDAAFRFIIAKHGKPDVFYTEFTSSDGLMSPGQAKLLHHLKFSDIERPIVAQIFGTQPDKFRETAKLVKELGFDGFDINMGCPDKNIVKGGSCAGLFHNPDLAKEIILASKEGAGNLPVSVKIRIGDTKIDWENWIGKLLEAEPAAIAIHLRTRKEMSKVPAHWDEMTKIVTFINQHTTPDTRPIILGNGDVMSLAEANQKVLETGCDGVMMGRAIFGNPWLFNSDKTHVSEQEKLAVLLEHVELYDQMFNGVKPFDIMKRHFKAYVHGFDGAAELRAKLYECKNADEVRAVIKSRLD